MPEYRDPPQVNDVDLASEKFVFALEQMRDDYALSLVNKTFWAYEVFRQQNHDRRWQTNDALYFGWMPQRTWEGTTVPRSSLSMPLVFDQVEAACPAIMQALFGAQPDWFQIEAEAGAEPEQARAIQARLLYLLDHDKDDYGLTVRNDIALAVKCMLLYGNGGVGVEWDSTTGRPQVSWIDNRDIYFDPSAPIPSADYCRSVIRRSVKTVQEVKDWRNVRGMKIPDDEVLWTMANSNYWTAGDQSKQIQSGLQGIMYAPNTQDMLPNPSDRNIEVLTYYSKSRMIVVLNRKWVAFVGDNPYGFIPVCFAPCYIVPSKFYAMSIADVQEGNQRYAEALMNAHLDEIHLALHPPRIQKNSATLTPNQTRWRPGAVFKVANPKEDMIEMKAQQATTNVFEEIQFIQQLGEKRTGINALMSAGIPTPSNANRTATGVSSQTQGSANRLQTLVANVEDYMLVPLLYKMYKMIQLHQSDSDSQQAGRTPDGKSMLVDPNSFKAPVSFKILASSQMVTRDKLAQIFPFIVQYLLNGPLLAGLKEAQQTIDWDEMLALFQDTVGIGKLYKLVRPMNDQEKQQAHQPSPQMIQEQQKAQADNQVRLQMGQIKAQADVQKAQIMSQPEQKSPIELQLEQQKAQLEQQKMALQVQVEQQKAAIEAQKQAMALKIKQMEMALKAQEAQMNAQISAHKGQQDMQLQAQQAQMDMNRQQQQAQMDQEAAQTQHSTNLQMMDEKASAQRSQLQQMAQVKSSLGGQSSRDVNPRTQKPVKHKEK